MKTMSLLLIILRLLSFSAFLLLSPLFISQELCLWWQLFFVFVFVFVLQRENMKTFSKLDALKIDTFLILNAVKEAFE